MRHLLPALPFLAALQLHAETLSLGIARAGPPAGINLAKVPADPRPIDPAGWIQGWAVVPDLERGPLASPDTLDAFDRAAGGASMQFALHFN
jgi:hypothetical protein